MSILLVVLAAVVIITLISWTLSMVFQLFIAAMFWAAAGYIATRAMGGTGGSWVNIILIGLIGGFLGSIILKAINLGGLGDIWLIGQIISGSIGAIALIAVVRLIGDKDFARN